MEKNVFQQAKDALMNLVNMNQEPNEMEQQSAQEAIDAAYKEATPEEQQQLQELENQLKQKNQLK